MQSKNLESKPKHFDVFQNFLEQKWNKSKNYETKSKRFDVFHNF